MEGYILIRHGMFEFDGRIMTNLHTFKPLARGPDKIVND